MRFAIDLPNFGPYADPRTLAQLAREAEDRIVDFGKTLKNAFSDICHSVTSEFLPCFGLYTCLFGQRGRLHLSVLDWLLFGLLKLRRRSEFNLGTLQL